MPNLSVYQRIIMRAMATNGWRPCVYYESSEAHMQKTSLWQRLHAAIFPPEAIPVKPVAVVLKPWTQTEDEFFAYLDDRNFIASVEVGTEPNKQRTVLYTDGNTGEVFAMAVRWPNRYYYYTFEH